MESIGCLPGRFPALDVINWGCHFSQACLEKTNVNGYEGLVWSVVKFSKAQIKLQYQVTTGPFCRLNSEESM